MSELQQFPLGPGHGVGLWSYQPFDGHAHDWSGWASIARNGYEICMCCGINKLELWESVHRGFTEVDK